MLNSNQGKLRVGNWLPHRRAGKYSDSQVPRTAEDGRCVTSELVSEENTWSKPTHSAHTLFCTYNFANIRQKTLEYEEFLLLHFLAISLQ